MRILFVCMGNICRSPTAEGVLRKLAGELAPQLEIEIDSAGTHDYHAGQPPDVRAQAAARARGIELGTLRARQVEPKDFERFDLILAMDHANFSALTRRAPAQSRARVALFLEYAAHLALRDVPDPYYGDANGFERVLDLVEEASKGLLETLVRERERR